MEELEALGPRPSISSSPVRHEHKRSEPDSQHCQRAEKSLPQSPSPSLQNLARPRATYPFCRPALPIHARPNTTYGLDVAQTHRHPTAIPSGTRVPPPVSAHHPPVPPARHGRVPSAAVVPPAPGHAAASLSLLPWRAGEGTGRLRGFGGRSRSWERFSHDCPGRGEHVRLRHEASPSLASTSRPPPCQRAGNPFVRCQLSQEPWQCQPSYFPPRPANQGFLPPLSTQSFVPCTSVTISREVLTYCPVQGPPGHGLPQRIPQRIPQCPPTSSTKGSLLFPSWQMPG